MKRAMKAQEVILAGDSEKDHAVDGSRNNGGEDKGHF
jgi:hypothetical protein